MLCCGSSVAFIPHLTFDNVTKANVVPIFNGFLTTELVPGDVFFHRFHVADLEMGEGDETGNQVAATPILPNDTEYRTM